MLVTISLAQIDVARGQPEENLEKARRWVAEARRRGSDIIIFPELWASGYDLPNADRYAAPLGEGIFAQVADLARQHGIYITGSLLEAREGRVYNTAPLFDPRGELVGCYSKAHLFRLMEEEKYLAPGGEAPVFELPWGPTALAICYDLRFPELFRRYALGGARLVLLCAAWPHPRLAHWRTLLRARAIENQYFVAACNRVGQDESGHFCGRSAVLDPWGEAVIEAGEQEVLLTVTIDLARVDAVRETIPVFKDRRPEVYL